MIYVVALVAIAAIVYVAYLHNQQIKLVKEIEEQLEDVWEEMLFVLKVARGEIKLKKKDKPRMVSNGLGFNKKGEMVYAPKKKRGRPRKK